MAINNLITNMDTITTSSDETITVVEVVDVRADGYFVSGDILTFTTLSADTIPSPFDLV